MESPLNEEQGPAGDAANDQDSTGMVNDYDVNTASRFFALNAVTPPDVWSRVVQPGPTPVAETSETVSMSEPIQPQLLESDLRSVPSVAGPHAAAVSRRPLSESLPASRHLVSMAAVVLFAVITAGAVWGLTRQADTTVADGGGPDVATELAAATSDGDDGATGKNGQDGSRQSQFAADDDDSVDESDDAVTEPEQFELDESSERSDDSDEKPNTDDSDRDEKVTTTTVESTTATTVKETTTTEAITTTTPDPTDFTNITQGSSTTNDERTTTTSKGSSSGEIITIRGLLTESFADCQALTVLDRNGNPVVSDEPVTCDGGSWILVNNTRIRTEAGNVMSGYFNKHKKILPGTIVEVKTAKDQYGTLSLSCDGCSYYAVGDTGTNTSVISGRISEIVHECPVGDRGDATSQPLPDCRDNSWIVVNGTKIATAGFDRSGVRFNRHQSSWEIGMTVRVFAIDAPPTLSCDQCSVKILG